MQDPQEKLEQRHKIIKTDDDIIHQVLEVVGSKCRCAVESLKHDMMANENIASEKASKRSRASPLKDPGRSMWRSARATT